MAVSTARGQGTSPVRKIVVRLPFDEAELILISEAQRHNLNLVNVLDIRKGMENRGGTFRPYKIYQFCNLELGIRILADAPDYGAFQLCNVHRPSTGRRRCTMRGSLWTSVVSWPMG